MNWDAIGSISTLVGSVAIIATLIYLARQIRESNRLANSTMANEISKSFAEYNEMVISNPQIAELLARLKTRQYELTAAEAVQTQHLAFRLFDVYVQGQVAYNHGHLTNDSLQGLKDNLKWTMETFPGLEADFRRSLESLPTLNYEVFDYFQESGTKIEEPRE